MMMVSKSGPYLLYGLPIIAGLLWWPHADWSSQMTILTSISQVTALTGTVLFCLSFVLSARWKWVEYLFSGLNRVYIHHHLAGIYAFVLLLIHPIASVMAYWLISIDAAILLVFPSLANWIVTLGMTALLVMILLIILTLYVKMPYETWKSTHQWLGLSLLLGMIHALFIGSTIGSDMILKLFMFGMLVFGMVAFIWRIVHKYSKRRKYFYRVSEVREMGNHTLHLELAPQSAKLPYAGGQFAFVSVSQLGILNEPHPFSITSIPEDEHVSFGIKSLGDFTESLRMLDKDSVVELEGGYGKFGEVINRQPKQVWIAGGIGVTPFLSMLRSIRDDFVGEVHLYYCTADAAEAVYMDWISSIVSSRPALNVRAINYQSKAQGRFSVDYVKKELGELHAFDVYVCGPPPMMASVKKQLLASGVTKRQIHTEEFMMRD